MSDRNFFIFHVVAFVVFIMTMVWIASAALGCTPQQMQPVRAAAQQVNEAAHAARTMSELSKLSADAMELSADLANTVADCKATMEATPPPEPLGVHPCAWDVLAATQRAAQAIQTLAEAIAAVEQPEHASH